MPVLSNIGSSIDGVNNVIRILGKQKPGIHMCHINAQSLANKMDEFRYIFEQSGVDIICVSETWFNSSISDNLVRTYGYTALRNDRCSVGGGVAIYIKNHFWHKVICKSMHNDIVEYIFIELMFNGRKSLVGCIYRPNKNIPFDSLLTVLTNITVHYDDILLAGDLNSNLLCDTRLADCLESIGLYTINRTNPTHFTSSSSSLLDIFLVDSPTKALLYDQISAPCFSKHDLIFMTYDLCKPPEEPPQTYYNFNKMNYEQRRNVPPDKTWFDDNIVDLIKKRDHAYKRWKRFRTPELHEEYRRLRAVTNKSVKKAKSDYYENKFRTAIDSKKKWDIIKEVGIVLQANHVFPPFSCFEFKCVNSGDVLESCLHIKSDAVGLDKIYPKFIKVLLPNLLLHITHLFNSIITTGQYPMEWKQAKIIPIPKPGTNNDYRPIAILPFLSKAFEHLMHKQICEYLEHNKLLNARQSGFRPKHSCVTALVEVAENIRAIIDEGSLALLVLLDHSKAFDCVNHDILCKKLINLFNFSPTAVHLISNYLKHRVQMVLIDNKLSNPLQIKRGVPQGSILGPRLFCMFINDLPNTLEHSQFHIYADDVQIYLNCKKSNLTDGVDKLNNDLEAINTWAAENQIYINPKKSNLIVLNGRTSDIDLREHQVKIGSQIIVQVSKAKNLGINFNKTLTWNDQVVAATGKVFGMLRTLYKTQNFTPLHIRSLLAKSYLMPVLLYGSELFTKCDARSKHRLDVAYKAILRYVYGLRRFESCSEYRKHLYGIGFEDYLNNKSLLLMHKIIYTKTPEYLYSKLKFGRTNRRLLIIPMRHQLLVSEWQFFLNTSRLWNSLPAQIQNLSNAIQFKKALLKHCLNAE
ncbi:uncharacterized protein LOC142230955 [Haematobia irritans]|uniref:uncharacterized protein LOC142230955 n=1 Tax=Haematobia irritans TaxID=7368 RepID=UPI003F4F5B87